MQMRMVFFLVVVVGLSYGKGYSQQSDFCDAVTTILRDAPNRFRNIKGNTITSNETAITYECGIKVPGSIGSRFVVSMGLFYEGAFFQTRKKEELKALYDKYKDLLIACLAPQEYAVTFTPNFYPGLDGYKKVVLMQSTNTDAKAPAHVTMEATYNKDIKNYTIVIFIFEH